MSRPKTFHRRGRPWEQYGEDRPAKRPKYAVKRLCYEVAANKARRIFILLSDEEDDFIDVLVGEDEERFMVDEELIKKHSSFFRAALEHDFSEARERTVRLPECNPETFHDYASWIHLDRGTRRGELGRLLEGLFREQKRNALLELYCLSDRLCDLGLCNQIADTFLQHWSHLTSRPSFQEIESVYTSTPEESPLRRLVLDCFLGATWAWQLAGENRAEWLDTHRQRLPFDFLFDITRLSLTGDRDRKAGMPTMHDRCFYHEHNVEVAGCC